MKKILILLLSICFFNIGFAAPKKATPPKSTVNLPKNLTLAFVQTAQSAELKSIPGKAGYYQLILRQVNPYVTYFSERPHRMQGVVPLQNFVNAWSVGKNSFADNPPNGMVTGAVVNGQTNKNATFHLIILQSPRYNQKALAMAYVVRPISSQQFLYRHIIYQHAIMIIDGSNQAVLKRMKG